MYTMKKRIPLLSPETPIPGSPLVLAVENVGAVIRDELIRLLNAGPLDQKLFHRVEMVAGQTAHLMLAMIDTRDITKLVSDSTEDFGDFGLPTTMEGQMGSNVLATTPGTENFGMTAMRELVATFKPKPVTVATGPSLADLVESYKMLKHDDPSLAKLIREQIKDMVQPPVLEDKSADEVEAKYQQQIEEDRVAAGEIPF